MTFQPTANPPEKATPCNWDILTNPPGTTPRHLDLDDVRSMVNASAYAVRKGMGHTVHCTMRLDMSESFDPRQWLEWQGNLFHAMSKWLRRNDLPVSYAWVRELGRINGPHVHLLLHLPVELWGKFKTFMLEAGDFDPVPNASGESIVLKGGEFGTLCPTMRAGALIYLVKSVDPQIIARAPAADGGTRRLADALGIRVDPDRLPVSGLRCNASHSINTTARRRDNTWTELRTLAELRAYLHPPKSPRRKPARPK